MDSFSLMCILGLIVIVGNSHVASAQDYPEDYLNLHNEARSVLGWHNMPDLVWDDDLAAYAQNFSNHRKDCKIVSSNTNGRLFGENIAVSTGNMSGREAVKLWVDEAPHYNGYLNRCEGGECTHYTQVVWKRSKFIGCGKVKCNNGGTFVICNYDPPGNIGGEYPFME
ncbi:unnamed protein product [Lathyrus sativus]|nr:unnamed protein product [Lathyrus sativus]